jgi:glutathione synthase/RimK-type ligase-like ATP-grasp enzyme
MTATSPIPLTFLAGLTDAGREVVQVLDDNRLDVVLTGTCSFDNYLTPGRFRIHKVWLDGKPRMQKVKVSRGGLVNYIADPDSHTEALVKAMRVVEHVKRPCFNPPRLIAQTRRDQVARRLSGIRGLRVPRTVRFTPRHPRDFAQTAEAERLSYPVIVRLAGDHGGVSTVRVDSSADWDAIHQLPWGGRSVYLTEFVDYRDPDGLYRKHRIAMVSGVPLLRHVIIGADWLLHRSKRLDTPPYAAEETRRLQDFEKETLPRIRAVLGAIHQQMRLDYFGIDCHVSDGGELTLFETNATMNILQNSPSPNRWDAPCDRIREHLEALLIRFATKSSPRRPA